MGLFKFLPPDRIDVLRDGKIRFTQPGAFDDPFEFKPDVTYSEDDRAGIPKMAPRGATSADVLGAILKGVTSKEAKAGALLKELNKRFGVLSLARTPRSLPMWAYYAAGHRGFVIEFDTKHTFFRYRSGASVLRPVAYSKRRPRYVMTPMGPERDVEISNQVSATKSSQWRHEREVRITGNLSDGTALVGQRDLNGFPIVLFQLPSDTIKRVILGLRMVEDHRREVRKILREDRYSHVRAEYAAAHSTEFNLEFISYGKRT